MLNCKEKKEAEGCRQHEDIKVEEERNVLTSTWRQTATVSIHIIPNIATTLRRENDICYKEQKMSQCSPFQLQKDDNFESSQLLLN